MVSDGIVEDRGDEVEAGLDGDGHARREIAVEAQGGEAELGRALSAGRVAGAVAQILHVVDVEAQQVADAVREQQRDDAVGDELDGVAAQQMPRSTSPAASAWLARMWTLR